MRYFQGLWIVFALSCLLQGLCVVSCSWPVNFVELCLGLLQGVRVITLCEHTSYFPDPSSGNTLFSRCEVRYSSTIIQCGPEGKAESECIVDGGDMPLEVLSGVQGVEVRGVTFRNTHSEQATVRIHSDSQVVFQNCIWENNVVLGGSVVASAGSNMEFESVTFRNNIALDHEKGTSIFVEDNSNLYIGEKVCLQENLFGGEGMIVVDETSIYSLSNERLDCSFENNLIAPCHGLFAEKENLCISLDSAPASAPNIASSNPPTMYSVHPIDEVTIFPSLTSDSSLSSVPSNFREPVANPSSFLSASSFPVVLSNFPSLIFDLSDAPSISTQSTTPTISNSHSPSARPTKSLLSVKPSNFPISLINFTGTPSISNESEIPTIDSSDLSSTQPSASSISVSPSELSSLTFGFTGTPSISNEFVTPTTMKSNLPSMRPTPKFSLISSGIPSGVLRFTQMPHSSTESTNPTINIYTAFLPSRNPSLFSLHPIIGEDFSEKPSSYVSGTPIVEAYHPRQSNLPSLIPSMDIDASPTFVPTSSPTTFPDSRSMNPSYSSSSKEFKFYPTTSMPSEQTQSPSMSTKTYSGDGDIFLLLTAFCACIASVLALSYIIISKFGECFFSQEEGNITRS